MNMRTAMIHPYRHDLAGMDLKKIDAAISEAENRIEEYEPWLEALTTWREVLNTKWYLTGTSSTSDGLVALARAEAHPPAIARLLSDNVTWSVVGLSREPIDGPDQPPFRIISTDFLALEPSSVVEAHLGLLDDMEHELKVATDAPTPHRPEPRGFADWKTRLTELRAELVNLTTILPTALNAPIDIIDELLEGFDDVVETRAMLAVQS